MLQRKLLWDVSTCVQTHATQHAKLHAIHFASTTALVTVKTDVREVVREPAADKRSLMGGGVTFITLGAPSLLHY